MALNDLFEAVISGGMYGGEEFSTVLHYQCNDVGVDEGEAEDLENTLTTALLPYIQDALHTSRTISNIFVQNLSNLDDWHASSLSMQGELGGNPLPAVVAVGFRSPKQSPGYNRSRHNLPILNTAMISDVGIWDFGLADNYLYFIQQAFGLPLTSAGGSGFTPVTVVKAYSGGQFVSASKQSDVAGQWSCDAIPTTVKSRQTHYWLIVDEPA